jgi:hypothetical protein
MMVGAFSVTAQVDWWKQWYPVDFLDDLDPRLPKRVELLGNQYVVWADKDKNWHCFEDSECDRCGFADSESERIMMVLHSRCFQGQS